MERKKLESNVLDMNIVGVVPLPGRGVGRVCSEAWLTDAELQLSLSQVAGFDAHPSLRPPPHFGTIPGGKP